jgi:hypothetical protein
MKEILHTLQDVEAEMPEDSPVPLQVFFTFSHNHLKIKGSGSQLIELAAH